MSGGGFNNYFRPTLSRHEQADLSGYGGYTYTAPSRNRNYRQHSVPRFRSIPSFTDPEYEDESAHNPWQHPFENPNMTDPSRFPGYPMHPNPATLPIPVMRNNMALVIHGSPPRHTRHQTQTRDQREENSTSESTLNPDEQTKIKKEIYDPAAKKIARRLCSYYRDPKKYMVTEKEKEKDDDSKRCAVCLEDFEPKQVVMGTKCGHMFHEECIVPWVKSNGNCPVCRFQLCEKTSSRNGNNNHNVANVGAEDLFARQIVSVIRAMEEAFIWGDAAH